MYFNPTTHTKKLCILWIRLSNRSNANRVIFSYILFLLDAEEDLRSVKEGRRFLTPAIHAIIFSSPAT